MEELERAQERLENIRSVKPILNGLRTISLGSWQAALKRRGSVRSYAEQLKEMLPPLLPHLETEQGLADRIRRYLPFLPSHPWRAAWTSKLGATQRTRNSEWGHPERSEAKSPVVSEVEPRDLTSTTGEIPRLPSTCSGQAPAVARNDEFLRSGSDKEDRESRSNPVKALVIGSERGLCGRFNVAIAEEAERYLGRESLKTQRVELNVLGTRAQRALKRRGYEVDQVGTVSMTTLPPLSLAVDLARRWLREYEAYDLDAVDLIYNDYRGTGAYEPTVTRLIPPQVPTGQGDPTSERWPPPIIDTDPMSLYATVVEQWTAVQLYSVLLDSSAAEHSTRFQLMESATQNADELVEELTLVIQTARRQAITQEMAELATGAGLLEKE